jgi:hypothetical protein
LLGRIKKTKKHYYKAINARDSPLQFSVLYLSGALVNSDPNDDDIVPIIPPLLEEGTAVSDSAVCFVFPSPSDFSEGAGADENMEEKGEPILDITDL